MSGTGKPSRTKLDDARKGRDLLESGSIALALEHLTRAFESGTGDVETMSWYGLALVMGGVDRLRGVMLCEEALRRAGHAPSPDVFHNLGRAYLGVKYRSQAAEVLRRGSAAFPEHEGIQASLCEMGIRRRPVLPFLGRKNPLNKYLGLWWSRLFSSGRKEA